MFYWLFTEGRALLGGCLAPLLCLTVFTPLMVAGLLGAGIQRTGDPAAGVPTNAKPFVGWLVER